MILMKFRTRRSKSCLGIFDIQTSSNYNPILKAFPNIRNQIHFCNRTVKMVTVNLEAWPTWWHGHQLGSITLDLETSLSQKSNVNKNWDIFFRLCFKLWENIFPRSQKFMVPKNTQNSTILHLIKLAILWNDNVLRLWLSF